MPITKSAKKALRQAKKRTERNKAVKKNLSYLERQFKKAISLKKKEEAKDIYQKLQKALDKAAKVNVIKKNKSSRKKSRLMKKLNKLLKEEAQE
ncbi:30S ribosomal protein S20 [bacterium]|nr:30S ribosomal protein S20 [bacterium]